MAELPELGELTWASAFGTAFVLVFALMLPVLLLTTPRSGPACTLIVLGSGGHTTEMLSMLKSMPKSVAAGAVFIIAGTDAMSQTKLNQQFPGSQVRLTPRAREVRQSWITRYVQIRTHLFTLTHIHTIRASTLLHHPTSHGCACTVARS